MRCIQIVLKQLWMDKLIDSNAVQDLGVLYTRLEPKACQSIWEILTESGIRDETIISSNDLNY